MPEKNTAYLTTLTPLRGIAALIVVIFHCNLALMQFLPEGYTKLITEGWLWVDFFFVLSGFIMTYVYAKYFTRSCKWKDYKKFMGARFARVYPLHFVTTIWAFIIVLFITNRASSLDPFFAAIFNPRSLPECLLLIQSLHIYITAPLNTPSWSLSTEWWVYMVFPFIVPVFARLHNTGRFIMLAFILAFFLFLYYVLGNIVLGAPALGFISDWGLLRCLAGFMLGMLAFEVYKNKIAYSILKRSLSFVIAFAATLVCMHFGVNDIIIVFLFPFIILAAAYNNTRIKRMLDTKPLQRLGDWSFSIYMVHMPIIFIFLAFFINKNPGMFADFNTLLSQPPNYRLGLILCITVVVLTVITAWLTYSFVEVPARNYFNKIFETKAKQISIASLQV